MLVLPVIDLKDGVAVHGRAGQRDAYQPIQSLLAASPDPLALARGIVAQLGLRQIYLADLDAIGGQEPAWNVYQRLLDLGIRVWLDAGVQNVDQYRSLRERLGDDADIVFGLETLVDRAVLASALALGGPERTVVSLDLDEGLPRTQIADWQYVHPFRIAEHLLGMGVRRLILLDIRRVGMEQGTGTEALLRALRALDSDCQIICGGGIRHLHDVRQMVVDGADGVLVATALHDGRFDRQQIECIGRLGR